jgi:hypothetical protein
MALPVFHSQRDPEPTLDAERRQLKQRWGSMTPTGRLVLNRSLIRASVDTIDYVITHELCHIRHPHHGSAFSLAGFPRVESRKAALGGLFSGDRLDVLPWGLSHQAASILAKPGFGRRLASMAVLALGAALETLQVASQFWRRLRIRVDGMYTVTFLRG